MAYEPTIWKDRAIEKPRTFTLQNNPDGTITLMPAPGVITEEGTPVNANNLNNLEQGLKTHQADITAHKDTITTINGKTGTIVKADIVALGIPAADTNTTYGVVTTTVDGLMDNADKVKLNSIATGAQVNAVTAVAGKTGAVLLAKADVGLGSVENYGIATQAEAKVGTSLVKYMPPLRVKEAIAALGARVASGTYTGNQGASRIITTGFRPKYLIVHSKDANNRYAAVIDTATFGATWQPNSFGLNALSGILAITATGFTTTIELNISPVVYVWFAIY